MNNLPLKGVKVIDLTYYAAGPGSARILADWGADVIKVEPPTGDPVRGVGSQMGMPIAEDCNPFYSVMNTNKRCICVDLKTEEGKGVMERLLQNANVFVTSFRPGALKRLGLDYESMHERHPHIIYGTLNGYGELGPDKDKAGFDSVSYWARPGTMVALMEKDATPINPTMAFGDLSSACSLAGGICAGLYNQQRTGEGCKVLISLMSQALWTISPLIASSQWGDDYPKSRKRPWSPCNQPFPTKDGKWVYMSILDYGRMRKDLFRILQREDLLDDPRFADNDSCRANAEEMVRIIDKQFSTLYTQDELVKLLSEADIANERLGSPADSVDDPQAIANNYIINYTHRNGKVTKTALPPVKFNTTDVVIERMETPMLGEHTDEVLKEYGYTDAEIAALKEHKAVIQK